MKISDEELRHISSTTDLDMMRRMASELLAARKVVDAMRPFVGLIDGASGTLTLTWKQGDMHKATYRNVLNPAQFIKANDAIFEYDEATHD